MAIAIASPERAMPMPVGLFIPDHTGILLSRNPRIERAINLDLSTYPYPLNLQGRDYLESRWKRALDLHIALTSIPIWTIGTAIGAVAMVPDVLAVRKSPLMKQRRFGLGNVRFEMHKIRTQKEDTMDSGVITPTLVGKVLRKTSVDELPQMLNVLDGSMSFVGRRPIYPVDLKNLSRRLLVDMPFEIAQTHFGFTKQQWVEGGVNEDMVEEVRTFAALVKAEGLALFKRFRDNNGAKPGVTGLYQVLGRRDISPEDRAPLDLLYDERASFLLDTAIILATPRAVLSRNGAH